MKNIIYISLLIAVIIFTIIFHNTIISIGILFGIIPSQDKIYYMNNKEIVDDIINYKEYELNISTNLELLIKNDNKFNEPFILTNHIIEYIHIKTIDGASGVINIGYAKVSKKVAKKNKIYLYKLGWILKDRKYSKDIGIKFFP